MTSTISISNSRAGLIIESIEYRHKKNEWVESNYRTRAIITRGLYIFYPLFEDHFFVFKEGFSENSVLMYGLYSRAASNQERLMMARVRYKKLSP